MMDATRPTLSRRSLFKLGAFGATLLALPAWLRAGAPAAAARATSPGWTGPSNGDPGFTLADLPYPADALEPYIDARTMEIHHLRHHGGALNNANTLLADHPELRAKGALGILRDLNTVPATMRQGVINNLGNHVNHSLFWPLLAAPATYAPGPLRERLAAEFGSVEAFQARFATAAAQRFGSGWAWLSLTGEGQLRVHSTANQDTPIMEGLTPLIGLDVWEHAYYLRYQYRRGDYVQAFWSVLNWDVAEANYAAARVA
jgi:superoxide dismutase, Fe-Mn family